ncbi:hypothetical protein ACFY5J_14960 [Peribacillus butanolivorans]|uniref:hypothetical protein n=1 Tax=Peribacillus butanolivorans TaxID=421767 RepID=UPI0036BE55E4
MEVPLRIRVEELATAYGNNYKHVTFDKTTIKDIIQKFAVKSDGGKSVNGTGSKTGINVGKEDLETLRKKLGVPETQTIAIGKTDVKGCTKTVCMVFSFRCCFLYNLSSI